MNNADAAHTFRLDVKGADLRLTFTAAGIRPVLLKGAALSHLLHAGERSRPYSDIDLLVDPRQVERAEQLLIAEGFSRTESDGPVRQIDPGVSAAIGAHGASHATEWLRERDSLVIDLHDSLPQVGAPPEAAWRALTGDLTILPIGGVPTETLGRPAALMLIALHGAHHGPGWSQAAADLERALELFGLDSWTEARDLAVRLQADRAMGVGLGLNAVGAEMARQLGLSTEPTRVHQLLWAGAPWSAGVIESLIAQPSLHARVALIVRIVVPSPAAMRRGSALARRRHRGLIVAYVWRPFQLARRVPAGLRARNRTES